MSFFFLNYVLALPVKLRRIESVRLVFRADYTDIFINSGMDTRKLNNGKI